MIRRFPTEPTEQRRMNPFDLSGQVALVTGASGGLGLHFAKLLAKAGASVALMARRGHKVEEAALALKAQNRRVLAITGDVTRAARIAADLGPLSLLVNNAGLSSSAPALELSEQDWDRVLDTNLKGAWLVAQAAAKIWVAAKRPGNIVNIGSILGERVAKGVLPYAAAKAGLHHMTRALALEWARHDIRVNALAPGYIETDLSRAFLAGAAGQELIKRIPQRRLGRPEDLDGVLLLLASPASAYMTGSVIAVDGGHLNSTL
jgi:NAD(P)-dependent dehydrogenase (short-subunit alcohol dehydrogenase family)